MKYIDEHVLHHVHDQNQLNQEKVIKSNQIISFLSVLFTEEERVFFEIRQSPIKGFACNFRFLTFYRMFDYDSFPLFYIHRSNTK